MATAKSKKSVVATVAPQSGAEPVTQSQLEQIAPVAVVEPIAEPTIAPIVVGPTEQTTAKVKKSTSGKIPAVSSDIFGSVLTLNFANGKELAIDLRKLPENIQIQAGVHGLKQKLVDAAAIARNTDTGKEASIEDKFLAVKTVFDRLTGDNPQWNATREGGAPNAAGGLFLRAMCKITRNEPEVMRDLLAAKSKEDVAALKKNPRVIQTMADIQLADIGDTADASDDLLDALSGN